MIRQLLQVKLWWLPDFFVFIETTRRNIARSKNDRKMVVFLRDSILDKVELRKGNRKMNNKNMGVIKWADLFFGLREKREWRRKNVVSVV